MFHTGSLQASTCHGNVVGCIYNVEAVLGSVWKITPSGFNCFLPGGKGFKTCLSQLVEPLLLTLFFNFPTYASPRGKQGFTVTLDLVVSI